MTSLFWHACPQAVGVGAVADGGDELVHRPAIERFLLVVVAMVVVAQQHVIAVRRVQPARVDLIAQAVQVRVVGQQGALTTCTLGVA
jgi:hypothetical protein